MVDVSYRTSERFSNQFFRALDNYRENLPKFLAPEAAVVWNGNPLGGIEEFIQMYNYMPQTRHDVTGFNVHPLPNSSVQMLNLVLTTSGKVKFGSERGKDLFGFSAVFMLRQHPSDPSNLMVSSLSYRLIHRPEDSTLQM
jgi:hypothetical protein